MSGPTAQPVQRISYPPDLPIAARREEILETIRDNQVVIIAGETGSGKSTQLPKMCLELGLADRGWIGHTQPRRIAARSIAERVAEELGTEVGETVGYKVRFTDRVSPATAIKTMTDGILLAEIQHDRKLSKYSTVIIDEAHERSLTIDFMLGYLKRLLPKRPDLKVIVTSATIDTERFAAHFDDAPIISVSGRSYPVDLRYRPLVREDPADGETPARADTAAALSEPEGVVAAAHELVAEGPGDILVFCAGERDIRDTIDALGEDGPKDCELVPLYGRLSAAEQHRVFSPGRAQRRIVVATNVAETSLTVPRIRYVIDVGTARVSRYSFRTKVQRLPIEPVSQASANQRSGRCGRLGPGICVRLYSEEDYNQREEFTDPEIARTNLASVILQMYSLGLGDIEKFPFVDKPESRSIRDGMLLLDELDAIDHQRDRLSKTGRALGRLPVDPRFARMLVDANDNGCLAEMVIITAAMSVQDPRERPSEKRDAAAEMHRRFEVEGSDFLGWLKLWEYIENERAERSNSAFRRMCRREFLNFMRIREWQDIVRQLRRTAKDLKWMLNDVPAKPNMVHRSMLTGLLSQVGQLSRSQREFEGARQTRFVISRSSVLGKKKPRWVMAGELVETNQLWAHSAATIQPEWVERAGSHLVKRSYDEPEWDRAKASPMTIERVMLYGLALVAGRRVHYRRVDVAAARELFIHHALIEGEWDTHHDFFEQNEAELDEVRKLGARQRKDLFVEYDQLFEFYDARLPETVTSGADFDKWWNRRRKKDPHLLDLSVQELVPDEDVAATEEFPDFWEVDGLKLDIEYEYASGSDLDGMTIVIPEPLLPRVDETVFEWSVPGRRVEVVTALLRSLPKAQRKMFVPIPETVVEIMPNLGEPDGSLVRAVRRELERVGGEPVWAGDVDCANLPDHLRPAFKVVSESGEPVAAGRDLAAIREELASNHANKNALGVADSERDSTVQGQTSIERSGSTTWDFGEIAPVVVREVSGNEIELWPGLVDEGNGVGLQMFHDPGTRDESMWLGTRRLLRLNVGGSARMLDRLLDRRATLSLAASAYDSKLDWVNDAADCVFAELLRSHGGPAWNESDWARLRDYVRSQLPDVVEEVGGSAVELLNLSVALTNKLTQPVSNQLVAAYGDMLGQLERLTYAGCLSGIGAQRLDDAVRYVRGIEVRLEKLPERVARDRDSMKVCHELEAAFDAAAEKSRNGALIEDINWLLEEHRVAAFAQGIGVDNSNGKPSPKRIRSLIAEL